jgi:hypothetical protein
MEKVQQVGPRRLPELTPKPGDRRAAALCCSRHTRSRRNRSRKANSTVVDFASGVFSDDPWTTSPHLLAPPHLLSFGIQKTTFRYDIHVAGVEVESCSILVLLAAQ